MFKAIEKSTVLLLVSSLFLYSCGQKEEASKDEEETNDVLTAEVTTNMNLIRVSIPSPIEITKQISGAGCAYNKSMLNSSSKASGYSTKYQAAVNLGIYGADFGYVAGFNQSQDVLEYMAQIAKLAKTVGVESAFDEEFGKKLSSNLGKEDTLMNIIDQAYAKAERNLRSNDRVSSAALIIAGSWIEGLYIATEVVANKPKDGKNAGLYHGIYNHAFAYSYVVDLLSQYKKEADCAKMLEELKSIQAAMEGYGKNPKMGQGEALKLREAIAPLRNKFIS